MLHCPSPQACIHPIMSRQVQLGWRLKVKPADGDDLQGPQGQITDPEAFSQALLLSTAFKDEFKSVAASGPNCTSSRAAVGICSNKKEIINSVLCRIIAVHSLKGQAVIPRAEGPSTKSRAREQKPSVSLHPSITSPLPSAYLAAHSFVGKEKSCEVLGGAEPISGRSFLSSAQITSAEGPSFRFLLFSFRERARVSEYQSLSVSKTGWEVIYSWTMWNLSWFTTDQYFD